MLPSVIISPFGSSELEYLLLNAVSQELVVEVGADTGLVHRKHLQRILHPVEGGGLPHVVHSEVLQLRRHVLH